MFSTAIATQRTRYVINWKLQDAASYVKSQPKTAGDEASPTELALIPDLSKRFKCVPRLTWQSASTRTRARHRRVGTYASYVIEARTEMRSKLSVKWSATSASRGFAPRTSDVRHQVRTAINFILVILCLASPLVTVAADGRGQPNKLAAEFASHGYGFTLKHCNLPKTCGGKAAKEQQREVHETSNDLRVDQRTLSFDGLTVELWYVLEYAPGQFVTDGYKKPVVLGVTVTSANWPVIHGLRVGSPKSDVMKMLGGNAEPNGCHEYVNEDNQDSVTFCFKNDRVKSVQWTPWVDA